MVETISCTSKRNLCILFALQKFAAGRQLYLRPKTFTYTLTVYILSMLKVNGIECWIGKHLNPSDEIVHGNSTTRVEDGVTTIQTTIALKPSTAGVALSHQVEV